MILKLKTSLKINKLNLIFNYYKRILTFDLSVLNSPNEPVHFLGILPPGSESGSASLHADADLDPGGLFKCGSVRIQIRNTGSLHSVIFFT